MNRVYEITLDFKDTDTLMSNITYKQYDYGTSFMSLSLTFGGGVADLGNDTIVAVFKSAKGKVILDDNNRPSRAFGYVFNSKIGGVAIQIPKEVLDFPGRCICEVVAFAEGNIRRTTQSFAFQVVSSITDLEPIEPPPGFAAIVGRFLCGQLAVGHGVESIQEESELRYTPTLWINGVTPVNAVNMNKIENELQRLATSIDTLDSMQIGYETSADLNVKTVKDALDKLLYVPLTCSFTTTSSTQNEKGVVLSNIIFNWNYNKSVTSQVFDGQSLGISERSKVHASLNSNKTFTLNASDGKTNTSKSISFSFMYPIFIGYVDGGITAPTQEHIKAMTKRVVNPSSQSFTYNISNKRMCIAVPSNWTIRSVIDPNNFDIFSSFTQSTLSLSCLDGSNQTYKIYLSEPTSQSNFTVRFNT